MFFVLKKWMPQSAKHNEYSSFSKCEHPKVPLMMYTSPTVWLVNHCFTTSMTRTNWTGPAKRNVPLYGLYQFRYIGQPSSHDLKTMFHKIFSFKLFNCMLLLLNQVPSYDLKAAKLSWQCPFMPFDVLLTYFMTFPLNCK